MKYKASKRLALVLSSLLLATTSACSHNTETIKGYKTESQQEHSSDSLSESSSLESFDTEDYEEENLKVNQFDIYISEYEYEEYEESLREQFATLEVQIDEQDDDYISSIYIDGHNVKIKLTNANIVEGSLNNLIIPSLTLDEFTIYDSEYYKEYDNLPIIRQINR